MSNVCEWAQVYTQHKQIRIKTVSTINCKIYQELLDVRNIACFIQDEQMRYTPKYSQIYTV